jgi:hypothetical protein
MDIHCKHGIVFGIVLILVFPILWIVTADLEGSIISDMLFEFEWVILQFMPRINISGGPVLKDAMTIIFSLSAYHFTIGFIGGILLSLFNKWCRGQRVVYIARFFLIIGAIGWLVPWTGLTSSTRIELPNSERQGLFIDKDGNIFCGSSSYQRIQMYDADGDFIRGFNTHVGKGRGSYFSFTIEDNKLNIRLYRSLVQKAGALDRLIIYDLDGTLISTDDYQSPPNSKHYVENSRTDAKGNHYSFIGILFPRVVMISKDDDTSIVIRSPAWLWFFQAPFPAVAFIVLSLITLGWISRRRGWKTRMTFLKSNIQERQGTEPDLTRTQDGVGG